MGCADSLHHVELNAGGHADAFARWRAVEAAPLPDGTIVVSAVYEPLTGTSRERRWMADGTGLVVARLSANGKIAWALGAPTNLATTDGQRIATASDGATWILGDVKGPYANALSEKLDVLFPDTSGDRLVLTRVARDGRIALSQSLAALGVADADADPLRVATTQDGLAIAVLRTGRGVTVARIARDGSLRYVRRIDSAQPRLPSGPRDIRAFAAVTTGVLWLAGTTTWLPLAGNGNSAGEIAAKLSTETGEVLAAFALEGWGSPSSIATTDTAIVLARRTADRSRITVHDPSTFAETSTAYTLDGLEIVSLAADGDGRLYALANQSGDASLHHRDGTITRLRRWNGVVALRLSISRGEAEVLCMARGEITDGVDRQGVLAASIVAVTGAVTIVGSFAPFVWLGEAGPLHGTYGTEDQCGREDIGNTPGCDRMFWSTLSAFVVRLPVPGSTCVVP